jgi:hypothetical protein
VIRIDCCDKFCGGYQIQIMDAERLILETDSSGNLKQLPKLPANKQLEAIFLVLSDLTTEVITKRRVPHPAIAGKVNILGNIIDTIPETEWNLP